MIRKRSVRTGTLVLALLLPALGNLSATGQETAPRRPPEPFRVFVHASSPADAHLKAALAEALPMVRERVERRRHWFQLADSAETADLTLRLVNSRTGELGKGDRKTGDMFPGMGVAQPDDFRAYHFVDAVVAGGSVRADLSGLHVGPVKRESSARAAADHLADELERFCKQNHAALTRGRTETRPNEP